MRYKRGCGITALKIGLTLLFAVLYMLLFAPVDSDMAMYLNYMTLTQLNKAINNTVNGGVELFYWNKKEAVTLLQNNGLQLSKTLPQDGFVHSIHDNGSNVKTKIKNITETRQFKHWFGNWQSNPKKASKVVNDDGTPMVVYHGSKVKNINIFQTSNIHGTGGLYLTTNRSVS